MSHVLVTAGATRNPIDAIRYVSAGASGRTGVEIARHIAGIHEVLLLGSVEACLRAGTLHHEEFGSTRDLMAKMEHHIRRHPHGAVIHSAAVGDYEAEPLATKIPSKQAELVIRMHPAPKILDHIRQWAPDCYLVSFKAASPELSLDEIEAVARAQLLRSGSDLVFANRLGSLETTSMLVGPQATRRFKVRGAAVEALVEAVLNRA